MKRSLSLAAKSYFFELRDRIFAKRYGFFLAKNVDKSMCKNISKNLRGKESQKRVDHAEKTCHQRTLNYL